MGLRLWQRVRLAARSKDREMVRFSFVGEVPRDRHLTARARHPIVRRHDAAGAG
jgi:hypothetical protein